jgi:hypothetical protein
LLYCCGGGENPLGVLETFVEILAVDGTEAIRGTRILRKGIHVIEVASIAIMYLKVDWC